MTDYNVALLIETWESIKPFINSKDRFDVAESLVNLFDSYGLIDDIIDEHGLDKEIHAAVVSRFGLEDEVEEIEDEDIDTGED